jgi:hypothetical protein
VKNTVKEEKKAVKMAFFGIDGIDMDRWIDRDGNFLYLNKKIIGIDRK